MNIVVLQGRLTRNPDLKIVGDNTVCNFSIAVPKKYKKETMFVDCSAWGKTAEFIAKYFFKGSKIDVRGELDIRNYEKDGVKHKATNVVVSEVDFAGSKDNNSDNTKETEDTQQTVEDVRTSDLSPLGGYEDELRSYEDTLPF